DIAGAAWRDFDDDYTVGLLYARQLLLAGKPQQSSSILSQIHVLPYEGASLGRTVYEQALLMQAVAMIDDGKYKPAIALLDQSREWPEHLGVGKPYNTDTRFQDYLTAYCLTKLGREKEARPFTEQVIAYTLDNPRRSTFANLLGLKALRQTGQQTQIDTLLERLRDSKTAENQWVIEAFEERGAPVSEPTAFSHNPYYVIIADIAGW